MVNFYYLNDSLIYAGFVMSPVSHTLPNFTAIAKSLHVRITTARLPLEPLTLPDLGNGEARRMAFVRVSAEALAVQARIGLKGGTLRHEYHPRIELRLTPSELALEFMLPAQAWWDQRNLAGKLTMRRYRDEFRQLLLELDLATCVGHWHGHNRCDEHFTIEQLMRPRLMEAWMQTLTEGSEPLRIGRWYAVSELEPDMVPALARQVEKLNTIYRFAAWTSRNDFVSMYEQRFSSWAGEAASWQ